MTAGGSSETVRWDIIVWTGHYNTDSQLVAEPWVARYHCLNPALCYVQLLIDWRYYYLYNVGKYILSHSISKSF